MFTKSSESRFVYNNPNANFYQSLGNNNAFPGNYQANQPLIEHQEFPNNNILVHNNLGNVIKNDELIEYKLTVDSIDRNINIYPNPFNFRLMMLMNRINDSYNKPLINRTFKNVKYIKIDSIIMPKYYNIKETIDELVDDEDCDTTKERFILLQIKNISTNLLLGTNDVSNKPSVLFYPKTQYNDYSLFKPVDENSNVLYATNDKLINLNDIEFEFFNGKYEPMKFDCNVNQTNKSELDYPLNINKQVVINMRIGVVENKMNVDVNY